MGKTKVVDHKIIKLLMSTKREGMDKLVVYLQESDFFWAPASTRFHGAYLGGLVEHVLMVHEILNACPFVNKLGEVVNSGQKPLEITPAALIIPPLLHDLCKVDTYIATKPGAKQPYRWNKAAPKGHATLSIARIRKHIQLTQLEALMIKFHMGIYGAEEFYEKGSWEYNSSAEYPLKGDHSIDADMTKDESQTARYGQSLRNVWYHNPIVKLMYFADESATMKTKYDAI